MNQKELFDKVKNMRKNTVLRIQQSDWDSAYTTPPRVLVAQWTGERGSLLGKKFTVKTVPGIEYIITRYE